ncbi:P-loop containing nucleoside triphosphate hydrolase protein [Periconia macrospinosa]|uniref:Kinesin-like protein n=1 Tax=Periconia macrospinosa TaxID=97972 RepID=A0A2V1EDN2_9PLEO|nr:P-loop containing nucleoside triphosphate hydrolase protein [Periconia macrospinosa]
MSNNQNPIASNQNPIASNQNPIASNQNPIASNQNPIASNQNPISNDQDTITSKQSPTIEPRDPQCEDTKRTDAQPEEQQLPGYKLTSLWPEEQHPSGYKRKNSWPDTARSLILRAEEAYDLKRALDQERIAALQAEVLSARSGLEAAIYKATNPRIRVMLRVVNAKPSHTSRPVVPDCTLTVGKGHQITLGNLPATAQKSSETFQFDYVFDKESTNPEVYVAARYLVGTVLQGFNASIFSDGHSGSGKSCTMLASDNSIAYLAGSQLLARDKVATISISCLELYQRGAKTPITAPEAFLATHQIVPESGSDGDSYVVSNERALRALLQHIVLSRKQRETTHNRTSSRSHVLISISAQASSNTGNKRFGKLYLVDLAGAEKGDDANDTAETTNINKSRTSVITLLQSLRMGTHMNFRDSPTTAALREIFTSSPTPPHASTLYLAHVNTWHDRNSTKATLERASNLRSCERSSKA